jgi:hypothetical protein
MRLSDKCLKTAKSGDKSIKLFDGGGLYLEVMPAGGKLWRLKYRFAGKEKRIAFGPYPLVSLKEAREKRDAAKKLLLNNIDPTLARQEAKMSCFTDTSNTFEAIAIEWHDITKGKWSLDYSETILKRMKADIFPKIGNIPIKKITPPIYLML